MSRLALKNHPLTRIAHYAFLLPFLPALRPLLVNFRMTDLIIYATGMALVIFLVIYGNQRPLLRIEEKHLSLYLHYRHKAETHPYEHISGFRKLSKTRIMLESRDHRPVTLRLRARDINTLVERLEEKNIHASK